MVSPTFTFKTRLTSTTAVCAVLACVSIYLHRNTSFLLDIVYCWMIKGIEKSCLKMAQGRHEVLTGDLEGLTWDEFERRVMTWAQPKYGASYALSLIHI